MPLYAGKLDRRITIQYKVSTRDAAFNAETYTWATLATVWAEAIPTRGIEPYLTDQFDAQRYYTFRIRWRTDIDETMQILHDGYTYNILGMTEQNRREALVIQAYAHVVAKVPA